jgi:hypothetical protein
MATDYHYCTFCRRVHNFGYDEIGASVTLLACKRGDDITKQKPATLPKPMLTSQPPDWIAAFKAQADAQGLKLSTWVGEACKAKLPADVRKGLSKRAPAHRPAKE